MRLRLSCASLLCDYGEEEFYVLITFSTFIREMILNPCKLNGVLRQWACFFCLWKCILSVYVPSSCCICYSSPVTMDVSFSFLSFLFFLFFFGGGGRLERSTIENIYTGIYCALIIFKFLLNYFGNR